MLEIAAAMLMAGAAVAVLALSATGLLIGLAFFVEGQGISAAHIPSTGTSNREGTPQ